MAKTVKTSTSSPSVPISGDLDKYKDDEVAASGSQSDDPEGDLAEMDASRQEKNYETSRQAFASPTTPAEDAVETSLPPMGDYQKIAKAGGEDHMRSAQQTDWSKVTGIPYMTDDFLSGRSALSGYLRSNKRPTAPDYDDRREKALRWQRGIALMGQLGGLIGDMRTGGRSGGGVTYQRDMGKQTDDYLRNSIDAIRQSYVDQVARYTEADRLWRKGLYDAWVHDEDQAVKYGTSLAPLAKGQFVGKDGLRYDDNGHYAGGGGSDKRRSYVGLNVGHLRFDFKNKATADNFIEGMYDRAMSDIDYLQDRLRAYNRIHPDKNLDKALMGENVSLDDMMSAMEYLKHQDKQLHDQIFGRNHREAVTAYLTSAGVSEDILRDAARVSENWTEDMIDRVLQGRRDRLNMTNAIRQKHAELWDDLQANGGGNPLSAQETQRRFREQNLPHGRLFRGSPRYVDDATLLSLNDDDLSRYYYSVTGSPYNAADFYNYRDFGAGTRTSREGLTGGKESDSQLVLNADMERGRNKFKKAILAKDASEASILKAWRELENYLIEQGVREDLAKETMEKWFVEISTGKDL